MTSSDRSVKQHEPEPNEHRRRVVLWIAVIGCMIVIVTGWMFVQVDRFRMSGDEESMWAATPFEQMRNDLTSTFSEFQDIFSSDAQAQTTYTEEQQQLQDDVFPQFVTEE